MKKKLTRGFGVVAPVFSLDSPYGIGTFGREAYEFIDFLHMAGASYWQLLPLGITTYGDSPYQSFYSYGGNPYFIDLDLLVDKGLLTKKEIKACGFKDDGRVDYGLLYQKRYDVLRRAFARLSPSQEKKLELFYNKNVTWLRDFALFMILKDMHQGRPWYEWEEDYKTRYEKALNILINKKEDDFKFQVFLQYEFFNQWSKLRAYANKKGIKIIGDLPIYIPMDSVDAWVNPHILQLEEDLTPSLVSGAPPDDYNDKGQLWNTPIYDWEYLRVNKYEYWVDKLAGNMNLCDIIRLDHFIGFENYWAIDPLDGDARKGQWVKGPGQDFFRQVFDRLAQINLIVEDLGALNQDVIDLREKIGCPGMKVIQFGFSKDMKSDSLIHNYKPNMVAYSSTHDSSTLMGWMDDLDKEGLDLVKKYFGLSYDENYNWKIIRALMASVADLAMFSVADLLGFKDQARINVPGSLGDNWTWRMDKNLLDKEIADRLRLMAYLYDR